MAPADPEPGRASGRSAPDFTAALAANAAAREAAAGMPPAAPGTPVNGHGNGSSAMFPAPPVDAAVPDLTAPADPTDPSPELIVDLRTPGTATSVGSAGATVHPSAPPSDAATGVEPIDPWDPVDPWSPVGARTWNPVDQWDPSAPSGADLPPVPTPPGPAAVPPPFASTGPGHAAGTAFPHQPDVGTDHGDERTAGADPGRGPAGSGWAPTPPVAPGSPAPSYVAPASDEPTQVASPSPALAGRVLRLFLPALVTLVIAAVAAAGFANRAGSLQDRAADADRAAAQHQAARTATDQLWAGVVALVASGVGQEVTTLAEVQAQLGEVRAAAADLSPEASGVSAEAAVQSRRAFVDEVERALGAAGGDPLELGNSLTELDARHRDAVAGAAATAEALETRAAELRRTADRTALAAPVLVVAGLALAAFTLVVARRRLVDLLDLPVARLRDALRRFRSGEPDVRSHAAGAPELAALGTELDDVLGELGTHLEALRQRAEWGEQSRMILDALDLADDEDTLFEVVTRALGVIDPGRPVELLMSERGPSRLTVVASNPNVEPPADPIDTHGVCVALRRGQVSVFESSSSINSCPMLRHRAGGPISGVCVPVTVAARPVGVLHMTGPEFHPPEPHVVDRLVSLASQIGNRLGSLRTLESTRHEASTDGLTGLPNRRSLESDVAELLASGTPFVMVLADLDKFKRLNDNFGHEVGDKALQLFAGVLRDNVRGNDVVARLGGEEFVLVYPNMSVEISIEAIGRLRAALARALAASAVPPFTCSFGVTHSSVGADGDSILRIADAGLLRAKELGGDQAVFADAEVAAQVFADAEAADRAGRGAGDRR